MRRIAIILALLTLTAFSLFGALAASQYHIYLPLVGCTSGCTGPTSGHSNPTPGPGISISHMVELINQARTVVGCPAVVANTSLMQGAQDWASSMASTGDYRHSDGGYYEARGYHGGGLVENIDAAAMDADSAFRHWMGSSPHKANIEFCLRPDNPSYSPTLAYEIGVGYADGYWTLAIGVRQP